jgi:hypothetical protein
MLAAALLFPSPDAAAFKCLPIYGNWCGPDHPQEGIYPPPIDPFDAACMRHDLCTGAMGTDTPCDLAFVAELRTVATRYGYMPRPLQWAEYVIRLKTGGPWGGMPLPTPADALGIASSLTAPCW